jgi:hypothetical protein
MTRYIHPKGKGKTFATIYAHENNRIELKLNLRSINAYIHYLDGCAESIRESILHTHACESCKKACGGVLFEYKGVEYRKCPWYIFRFDDFSEMAVNDYMKLIELEDNELTNERYTG